MKIYTVMTFECNGLESFDHFKDKYDAIYYLHKSLRLSESQIDTLIKNGYYFDDNGYEVYFLDKEVKSII